MAVPTAVLDASGAIVEPGRGASCSLRIRNNNDVPAEFELEPLGAPAAWASVNPKVLVVEPGDEATAWIVFGPSRSPTLLPGRIPFQVRILPSDGAGDETLIDGVVEVTAFTDLSAAMSPKAAAGRRRSVHRLTIENRGNAASRATINAQANSGLSIAVEPAEVDLGPGGNAQVQVSADAGRPPLWGSTRDHRFRVSVCPHAEDLTGEAVHLDATLRQQPVRWFLPLAGLGLIVAVVVGLVIAGGGDNGSSTGTRVAGLSAQAPAVPTPRFAVGSRTETFVDASRPTNAYLDVPAQPTRTLPTLILYPAEGPAGSEPAPGQGQPAAGGPFPLIVFAHGSGGNVDRYFNLLRNWAAGGYVVAAPTFPFARNAGATSPDDYPNQPADMSFVATELIRLSGEDASVLRGLVDPARVGAAGHSLGGVTTLGLAAHPCCHGPRFKAAAVLAGREAPFPNGELFQRISTPLLVIHGDRDASVPYAEGRLVYMDAPPPRFLVTILGADHGAPYQGAEARPDVRVVFAATLDFFDHYLRGTPEGLTRLVSHASVNAVATIESEH